MAYGNIHIAARADDLTKGYDSDAAKYQNGLLHLAPTSYLTVAERLAHYIANDLRP